MPPFPDPSGLALYMAPMAATWCLYGVSRRRRHKRSLAIREAAWKAGLTQPSSLHPIVDHGRCIGCAACAEACPEAGVLGIIGGKAELIGPTHCIGHGACAEACPTGAITLVFGTAERGVDIPHVGSDFQTNVEGIFIAGELGGMGLIRNAIEQGRLAVDAIAERRAPVGSAMIDLVIVGAGPAGFAASLAALEKRLRFATVEQETLGGTVAHYPRGKIVMTAPAILPIVGKVPFRETTKETLLEFWHEAQQRSGVEIRTGERLERIDKSDGGFEVTTSRDVYRTRNVLLAIGRRGTPRKLGVPGEDLPKVVYHLIDPEQYRGRRVIVTGGGDSALEAATSIAAEPDTSVTLVYRGEAFARAKPANRERVEKAQQEGRLDVMLRSNIKAIAENCVTIARDTGLCELENDDVIICAGGVLPTKMLREIGIAVETKFGTP